MPLDTRQLRLRAVCDTEPTRLVDPSTLRNRSVSAKHHRIIAEAHTTFGPLSGDDPRDSSLKVLPSPGSSSASRSVVIRRAFKPTPINPATAQASATDAPSGVVIGGPRPSNRLRPYPDGRPRHPHDIAPKRNQRIIVTEPLVRSRRRRRVETDHLFTGTDIAIEQCGIHTKISATKIIELDQTQDHRAQRSPRRMIGRHRALHPLRVYGRPLHCCAD